VNRLLIATRSEGKAREIKEILEEHKAGVEAVSLEDARVAWSSVEDKLEEFDSFQSNARSKAEYFAKLTGLPTVADDSGLEVLSLMGKPGVRSKRFAPNAANLTGKQLDEANNQELLRRLLGAEEKRRRANYTCVAVMLRRPGAAPVDFTGKVWGRILEEPRGTGGFGYDRYFYHEESGKTFAEMTPAEKHAVSHRGEAFRQVAEALAQRGVG
jgi:XTP/dITP diphosphohydrolase